MTKTLLYGSTHAGVSSSYESALFCWEQSVNILWLNKCIKKKKTGYFSFLSKVFNFNPVDFQVLKSPLAWMFLLETLFQQNKHKIEITSASSCSLDIVSEWPNTTHARCALQWLRLQFERHRAPVWCHLASDRGQVTGCGSSRHMSS